MMNLTYHHPDFAIRDDLTACHARAWARLARPGTWLSGPERVAVAAEVRAARNCALCAGRKAALSPYTVAGGHDQCTTLPAAMVEAAHRIATDPGRLRRAWFEGLRADGLAETHYVELVGVIVIVVSVDTFCRGVGLPPPALPQPVDGPPGRIRPAAARQHGHWVATIDPADAAGPEHDLYAGTNGTNIYRALSLVPDEARGFIDLDDHLYLPGDAIFDFDRSLRALSHAQMELVAGRVSALNNCVY